MSKHKDVRQNRVIQETQRPAERLPDYWFCARRHTGDMTIIQACLRNKGDLSLKDITRKVI